ncbi:MAG: DUF1579 domain-containing protein [Bryobacteraceae bacterium]|nr:DUF1579 domain-containing protein [Bryobacteraceae bacterium]
MSAPGMEDRIREATAVFERDVGDWEADIEIRPGPGTPPVRQKGGATNRTICGGRWLVVEHRSETGFEGHGVYGWDPSKDRYTGAWVDSMQTCITRSEGTWDAAGRTMTFETEAVHQGRVIRYREIIQTLDDGSRLYRNIVPMPDGSEFEMIRAMYRRAGGSA